MNEFSSSGESLEESGFERRTVRDKCDRDFDGKSWDIPINVHEETVYHSPVLNHLTDYVRVYDGMDRYRRHQCRYLSLGKNVSVRKVVELSLKAFQLPPDEEHVFYLVEINERGKRFFRLHSWAHAFVNSAYFHLTDGSEHRLDSNTPFRRQLQFETRRPQILLRYIERPNNREYVTIYPGSLQ